MLSRMRRPKDSSARLSRTRVLDATSACLDELGYDQTTIRTIARRLECAVGSIYRYSRDKRELLDAVVQRRFEPVAEQAEQGQPIDQTTRQYLSVAAASPEQYRLMLWLAAVQHPEPMKAPLPGVIDRIILAWSKQLGSIEQARRHWALAHGAAMMGLSEL
jgi:AcrR family transcriptional regulator